MRVPPIRSPGVRVIELAHIMAGPACGLMLADMGADVIKVEKPEGDDSRRFLPPVIENESAAFMMMNRNKHSIVLDLKNNRDRAAFLDAIMGADILIENHRKGDEKAGPGPRCIGDGEPGLGACRDIRRRPDRPLRRPRRL